MTNSAYNQSSRPAAAATDSERFTSMQAAQLSGVPFFTVDYWDRSRFLRPTVARGSGRGRGRERMYSYEDILRLRIARDLRDEGVSLETLRRVVGKLGAHAGELASARWVVVRREVEVVRSDADLATALTRDGSRTFGVVLDVGRVIAHVAPRIARLRESEAAAERRRAASERRRAPGPGSRRFVKARGRRRD